MLRAALWHWRGDPLWATVTAARAARMLGIFLVVGGLYGFLRTGWISLLWLGFIGWFLAGAATAEEQQALVEDRLTSVRVGDVMTPTPHRRTSPCRSSSTSTSSSGVTPRSRCSPTGTSSAWSRYGG